MFVAASISETEAQHSRVTVTPSRPNQLRSELVALVREARFVVDAIAAGWEREHLEIPRVVGRLVADWLVRAVSAALGELTETGAGLDVPAGLSFVKWGLAGAARLNWRKAFLSRIEQLAQGGTGRGEAPRAVVVAYADAERAGAPSVEEVVAFACEVARTRPAAGGILLVDTFDKRSSSPSGRPLTLLDWLSVPAVTVLCQRCRSAGVRVAMAGSLGVSEVRRLLPARPDWFAVRGVACVQGDRGQEIDADHVRALVRILNTAHWK